MKYGTHMRNVGTFCIHDIYKKPKIAIGEKKKT